jgi:hypothetical protein
VRTPGLAALVGAPFGDPSVEWKEDSPARACANRITSLPESPPDIGAPVFDSPLTSPRRPTGEFVQVALYGHIDELRVSEIAGVAASLDHDKWLTVGQLGAHPLSQFDIDGGVGGAMDHQCGDLDVTEPIVDVLTCHQRIKGGP